MFSVIICGSRDFNDYEKLRDYCDYYLSKKMIEDNVVILSGGAIGADELGEKYAKERGLECKRIPAEWGKYGKRAGMIRNAKMAEIANACIAFPSPYSENKGTNHMIRIARQKNLLVRIVNDD